MSDYCHGPVLIYAGKLLCFLDIGATALSPHMCVSLRLSILYHSVVLSTVKLMLWWNVLAATLRLSITLSLQELHLGLATNGASCMFQLTLPEVDLVKHSRIYSTYCL